MIDTNFITLSTFQMSRFRGIAGFLRLDNIESVTRRVILDRWKSTKDNEGKKEHSAMFDYLMGTLHNDRGGIFLIHI